MVVSKDLKSYLKSKGYEYIPSNKMQKEYFIKLNKGSKSNILTENENGYSYLFETIANVRNNDEMDIIINDFRELVNLVNEINSKEVKKK